MGGDRSGLPCTIAGCQRVRFSRTWCNAHYHRWREYGDPQGTPPPAPLVTEGVPEVTLRRFNAKFAVDAATGCWLWSGSVNRGGYGTFTRPPRRFVQAHRFAYEVFREAIPDGMVIDHLCRVRRCVNPNHMEVVTFTENVRRGMSPSAIKWRARREGGVA